MLDLIIKGGTLPDGTISDIAIKGERIVATGKVDAEALRTIDATGDLVSPPLVDPHFHMDATLSYGLPRVNASGTLLEGIGLWGELREKCFHHKVFNSIDALEDDWALGLLAMENTPAVIKPITNGPWIFHPKYRSYPTSARAGGGVGRTVCRVIRSQM